MGSTACVESRAGMYVRFPGYATTAVEQRQLEREAGRPWALRHPPTPPRKNHLLFLLFLLFSSLLLQSLTSLIFLCTAIVLSTFATFFHLKTFSVWCHSLDCDINVLNACNNLTFSSFQKLTLSCQLYRTCLASTQDLGCFLHLLD